MSREDMVLAAVNKAYPGAITEVVRFRDELTLVIDSAKLKGVAQLLKESAELDYNFLSDICADDLLPATPRFAVNYHLYSITHNHRLRLRVAVADPDKGPVTMASVWIIATWLEMEVWDLMGITFAGNTQLRRLFLPEDWQGHPLRKDYPLGYEEVQFTFNREAIDAKKMYAQK